MSSNNLGTLHPNHLQVHLPARSYIPHTFRLPAQNENHSVNIFSFSVVDHHQDLQADVGFPHKALLFEYTLETPISLDDASPAVC